MINFRRWIEREQHAGFKKTYKIVRDEINRIEKESDPAQRLSMYDDLEAGRKGTDGLAAVFGEDDEDVQQAIAKPSAEQDGAIYYMRPIPLGIGFVGLASVVSGITVLFPAAALAIPASALLFGVGLFLGRNLLFRSRSKNAHMSVQDVKYARKMKKQRKRVHDAINSLSFKPDTKKNLDSLCDEFGSEAAKTKHTKKLQSIRRPVVERLPMPQTRGPGTQGPSS